MFKLVECLLPGRRKNASARKSSDTDSISRQWTQASEAQQELQKSAEYSADTLGRDTNSGKCVSQSISATPESAKPAEEQSKLRAPTAWEAPSACKPPLPAQPALWIPSNASNAHSRPGGHRTPESPIPSALKPARDQTQTGPSEKAPSARSEEEVHDEAAERHKLLVTHSGLPSSHAVFKKWRLTDMVGSGAFSKVYKAQTCSAYSVADTCVLKVVHLGQGCSIRDDYKPVLRAEGKVLQRFQQSGFVKCYEAYGCSSNPKAGTTPAVQEPDALVLALQNLKGGMLLDKLKVGPLPEHHAAAAIFQILTCVIYMHHNGYLHRDIKPDNVMLAHAWEPDASGGVPPPVTLIDLGMAIDFVASPHETGLMGSPGYMAPEAIRGHRHTPQMDMYSIGVLLFVMLTGCKPIPSAICGKLEYGSTETSDYPGVHSHLFKRLSPAARDLTLALMQRRPGERPCARAAITHCWLQHHQQGWLQRGYDLWQLTVKLPELQDLLQRVPRADLLLAEARASTSIPHKLKQQRLHAKTAYSQACDASGRADSRPLTSRAASRECTVVWQGEGSESNTSLPASKGAVKPGQISMQSASGAGAATHSSNSKPGLLASSAAGGDQQIRKTDC